MSNTSSNSNFIFFKLYSILGFKYLGSVIINRKNEDLNTIFIFICQILNLNFNKKKSENFLKFYMIYFKFYCKLIIGRFIIIIF